MGRKMMSLSSPLMEITMEDDTISIKNSSLLRTVESKFKYGEEYEEVMPNAVIKVSKMFNESRYLAKYGAVKENI